MGCGASVSKKVNDSSSPDAKKSGEHSYVQIINEKCPLIRLDFSQTVKQMPRMNGISYSYNLRYCYVSQRGYYPNALGKANQDSYLICEKMLGDDKCHVFGIFDGHGEYGDYCSHYAADKVSFAKYKQHNFFTHTHTYHTHTYTLTTHTHHTHTHHTS